MSTRAASHPLVSAALVVTACVAATHASLARAADGADHRTVVHTVALAPLPVALDGAAAAATSDAIFVAGGESPRGLSSTLYRLDGRTGEVSVVTDRLIARRDHALVIVDDTLVILGGKNRRSVESSVERVDLTTGEITRGARMPTPRARLGAVARGQHVVTAGGTMGWGHANTVEIYDVGEDRWLRALPLAEARDGVLVDVDGLTYAVGGGGQRGPSSTVERFDGRRFVRAPSLPRAVSGHRALAVDGRILVVGDTSDPRQLTFVDPVRRDVFTLRSAHTVRDGAAYAALGGRVVVIGGSVDGRPTDLVEMLTFE